VKIVIIGLSITSSWGNGHATTFRSLVAGLAQFGQDVLFLEQDRPWYAAHRDMPHPPFCETILYNDAGELGSIHAEAIAEADLVIVGSYVADGPAVCELVQRTAKGVKAFYDIDTPITLAALAQGRCDYITAALIPGFDLYLSFTGGPTLRVIERRFGAKAARALYCSADPDLNVPDSNVEPAYDLGYLGTYSQDRQPKLDLLLCTPARLWPEGRFNVTGPQYPSIIHWPDNVARFEHAPPDEHRDFYASQRYTLNVTRADMIRAGYSPSVRLFEAAVCGTPIISDWWPGLETLFRPDVEIIVVHKPDDVLQTLRNTPEHVRRAMADRARSRVLQHHTGRHRAAELMGYVRDVNH
jgi:spore maturation protein CgeB